jgi:uncharacterized membrane protein YdfJ with MMPL/SSD domain
MYSGETGTVMEVKGLEEAMAGNNGGSGNSSAAAAGAAASSSSTILVRLLLVPAALRLLGPAAWWLPRWLDRLLPDLDVEGAKMQKATSKESFTLVA